MAGRATIDSQIFKTLSASRGWQPPRSAAARRGTQALGMALPCGAQDHRQAALDAATRKIWIHHLRVNNNSFLLEGLIACSVFLFTLGIASATAANNAPSLQEVIDRVKANEDKLSLIKMNFCADFTSEGKPPDRPRDPRASSPLKNPFRDNVVC